MYDRVRWVTAMRSPFIVSLVLALALAPVLFMQPVAAQPDMSIPFITTPQFFYVQPSQLATLVIIETNQSQLAADNTAAFALSFFPEQNSGAGGFTIAPTIAQTSSQDIFTAQTYTFQDFLNAAA
jgi:hypothetical protein